MELSGKPITELDKVDLEGLLNNEAALEGRTLDYKLQLPGGTNEEKREFLRDVCAFANTSGGYILYGIDEDQGKAVAMPGLGPIDQEAQILRLSNMAQSGITPRVTGLQFHAVPLGDNNWAIALHIPKSWAMPHMVTFSTTPAFWARNSRGKYDLSLDEIRTAFVTTDSVGERLRSYRFERLARIEAGETPVVVVSQPKVVLHVVPVASLQRTVSIDPSMVFRSAQWQRVALLGEAYRRFNIDGALLYQNAQVQGKQLAWDYIQIFRNGAVEVVDAFTLRDREEGLIPYVALENRLIPLCRRILAAQQHAGIDPPVVIFLSMLGVVGYRIPTRRLTYDVESQPIDRDNLLLPDTWLQDYPENTLSLIDQLKPALDALWNAAGMAEWLGYEECRTRLPIQ